MNPPPPPVGRGLHTARPAAHGRVEARDARQVGRAQARVEREAGRGLQRLRVTQQAVCVGVVVWRDAAQSLGHALRAAAGFQGVGEVLRGWACFY